MELQSIQLSVLFGFLLIHAWLASNAVECQRNAEHSMWVIRSQRIAASWEGRKDRGIGNE